MNGNDNKDRRTDGNRKEGRGREVRWRDACLISTNYGLQRQSKVIKEAVKSMQNRVESFDRSWINCGVKIDWMGQGENGKWESSKGRKISEWKEDLGKEGRSRNGMDKEMVGDNNRWNQLIHREKRRREGGVKEGRETWPFANCVRLFPPSHTTQMGIIRITILTLRQ